MLSQVPQDALLILLRQCYVRRSCRGSPRLVHQTTRPRLRSQKTSIRTLTSAPSSRNYDFVNDRSLRVPSGALNGICAGSARSFHISVRALSSDTNSKKTLDIAVLGGGITGLSTAYHLAKKLDANITLYEASDRLGGWLESKSVDVEDGTVLFEQGPRTLRPMGTVAGLATLELVKMLGLEHEMLITPKDAISARNRYIYYPDHLAKLPGPGDTLFEILWKMFTEPVLAGMVPAVIRDYRNTGRPENIEDESMGDFLTRRLGSPQLGDNMVSAVLHGIYAGNLYQLSVKSLFPWLWHTELEYGGWTRASMWLMSNKQYVTTQREYDLREDMHPTVSKMERFEELANASVYSFEGGIQTLSDALVHDVEGNPRVTVKKGTPIEHMAMNDARTSVQITTSGPSSEPALFDKVISTLPAKTLASLTQAPTTALTSSSASLLPSLTNTHAVTVMVVNLYFRSKNLLPVRGFGYLIPRSIPYEQNPELALGVIFDSDSRADAQASPLIDKEAWRATDSGKAEGTVVTVMLGGHWWDGWAPHYPDEAQGVAMARSVLERHLGIKEEPLATNVALQRECIPQYTVGHDARLKAAHEELARNFGGRLAVAGSSYTGVGLNDCVLAAREVVDRLVDIEEGGLASMGRAEWTGLERYATGDKWVVKPLERIVITKRE